MPNRLQRPTALPATPPRETHFGWSYLRNRDGSDTWTSPRGHHYTVDQRGTVTRH